MGPTETRSRDEWLAEVQRRGTRIRRGRRITVAPVGALALVLPGSALVTFLDSGGNDVSLSVAGPPSFGDVAGGSLPPTGPAPAPAAEPAPEMVETTVPELRVEAVHGRTAPPPRATPFVPPLPALPGDDPVVRSTTTVPSSGNSSSPILPPNQSTPGKPPADAAPCPASEVAVTVSTETSTYAPGEMVRGSSTIENRSATVCLLPTRGFFKVLNAAGKDVGNFASTADFRFPVRAEPGKTFTSSFTWDQRDCSGPACTPVLPGTYTVVAEWTESGPYAGRTTFRIGS